jgi:hypothetical protein
MGVVKKKTHTIGEVSLSALEDVWLRQATEAAIAGARGVISMNGPIPPGTQVGRLSETEWGWVFSSALFAWISKRAEQATSEQFNTEQVIRLTGWTPKVGILAQSWRFCPNSPPRFPISIGQNHSLLGRVKPWPNFCSRPCI